MEERIVRMENRMNKKRKKSPRKTMNKRKKIFAEGNNECKRRYELDNQIANVIRVKTLIDSVATWRKKLRMCTAVKTPGLYIKKHP